MKWGIGMQSVCYHILNNMVKQMVKSAQAPGFIPQPQYYTSLQSQYYTPPQPEAIKTPLQFDTLKGAVRNIYGVMGATLATGKYLYDKWLGDNNEFSGMSWRDYAKSGWQAGRDSAAVQTQEMASGFLDSFGIHSDTLQQRTENSRRAMEAKGYEKDVVDTVANGGRIAGTVSGAYVTGAAGTKAVGAVGKRVLVPAGEKLVAAGKSATNATSNAKKALGVAGQVVGKGVEYAGKGAKWVGQGPRVAGAIDAAAKGLEEGTAALSAQSAPQNQAPSSSPPTESNWDNYAGGGGNGQLMMALMLAQQMGGGGGAVTQGNMNVPSTGDEQLIRTVYSL